MTVPMRPRNTREQMLAKARDLEIKKLLDKAQNPPKEKN